MTSAKLVVGCIIKVAKTALQERLRIAGYPLPNIAWYVHPLVLAKADYSATDKFLEGSLIKECGTEAICIRWIGDEHLKHCTTHGNLRCVGLD